MHGAWPTSSLHITYGGSHETVERIDGPGGLPQFRHDVHLGVCEDDKKDEKKDKGGQVVVFGDEKKDEKKDGKDGHLVFGDDDKKDEKKDDKGGK